jgi:hypothetical protein
MGATKTASTYLQKCLGLNEELLRKHGVHLARAGRRSSTSNLNHHNLAWHLLEDRRFRSVHGDWDTLRTEVADVDAEVVVLSSEAFARLASEERLRSMLSKRLFEIADDVTLVYVVRDPLARINSMYTQAVKTFAGPDSFDVYATKSVKSGFYNLEESFRFWYQGSRATFVAIRFDDFVRDGPLQSLLGVLGLEIPSDDLTIPDDISNPSPGPVAVEAMRLLNAHLRVVDPGFSRRSAATTKLSQITQRRASKAGWNDEKFWGWESDRAVWAANRLANSNERFSQAVWGIPWPLDLPIKKAKTAVTLLDVPTKTLKNVDSYVSSMTRRYVKLIDRRPDDQTEDDVAVDELTVDSDEAERAGLAVPRSQRMRSE